LPLYNKKYSRVYVEITNICNRCCSFCPGTERPRMRMGLENFDRITEKLVGLTDYLYLHVMGEPLTHPELKEMIALASSRGFKCAITTNGTLLKERGESLLSSGLYKINISVHSFEEGSDEEHLEYVRGLAEFADKAADAGILTVLRLWNRGHDGGRNDRTLQLLQEMLRGEWRWGSRGARIRHKLHLEYGERFDWPDLSLPEGDSRVYCYGLADHFGILADGRVIPCCLDREGVMALGNALEENIEDILYSERAEAIRLGFLNRTACEPLCRRCGYARRFKV